MYNMALRIRLPSKGGSKMQKSEVLQNLSRSTFKIKKNSLLAWSISHLVPNIFWIFKNALH